MKTYVLADLQDIAGDNWEETEKGAKEFLSNLWANYEGTEENNPIFDRIEEADIKELNKMLEGVDYKLFTTNEFQGALKALEKETSFVN